MYKCLQMFVHLYEFIIFPYVDTLIPHMDTHKFTVIFESEYMNDRLYMVRGQCNLFVDDALHITLQASVYMPVILISTEHREAIEFQA